MKRACVLILLLVACGRSAPTQTTDPPKPIADEKNDLVGSWEGSLSGGPIAATRKDTFAKDGTYTMDGYPSIGERSRFAVVSRKGDSLEVRFTDRMRCGPCSNAGPNEANPEVTRTLEIAADRRSLRDGAWTLTKK